MNLKHNQKLYFSQANKDREVSSHSRAESLHDEEDACNKCILIQYYIHRKVIKALATAIAAVVKKQLDFV